MRARTGAAVDSSSGSGVVSQSSRVDLLGDHHLGAELLRLHEGAPGQRLAGNAGRESQVVLDARAGAGLAAERARVEHDDRKAFGSRIDGGGETGGPGADDRDIEDAVGVIDAPHAEALRQLGPRSDS